MIKLFLKCVSENSAGWFPILTNRQGTAKYVVITSTGSKENSSSKLSENIRNQFVQDHCYLIINDIKPCEEISYGERFPLRDIISIYDYGTKDLLNPTPTRYDLTR